MVVSVVLGVVTTVLVAWGFACRIDDKSIVWTQWNGRYPEEASVTERPQLFAYGVRSRAVDVRGWWIFWHAPTEQFHSEFFQAENLVIQGRWARLEFVGDIQTQDQTWGRLQSAIERIERTPDQPGPDTIEVAAGWPMRAMWGYWTSTYARTPLTHMSFVGGLVLRQPSPSTGDPLMVLPFIPIPWGFAANSALYGTFWAAVLIGFGAVRRTLRRRRNLCEACAYDRRGLAPGMPCPECGTHAPA